MPNPNTKNPMEKAESLKVDEGKWRKMEAGG
jgi:hypothetical protein